MRWKTLLISAASVILILLVVAMSLPPVARVQADNILQGMPRLDGFQIYFTEEAGETSRFDRTDSGLSRLAGLLELQGAELYTLEWRTGIPADADLLVIAGPAKDLTSDQTAWLWAYLQQGGRLLLMSESPLVPGFAALRSSGGLFSLMWSDMGLRARDDVVVTEGGTRVVVPLGDRVGRDTPTPTPLPLEEQPALISELVTTNLNRQHPILSGLEGQLTFFGARSLEVDEAPRTSQVTSLVTSDSTFYGETEYADYLSGALPEYNIGRDTTRTALVLAAVVVNIETGMRIVVIGDRDFAMNGMGLQTSPPYSASFLYPDNVRFLLNSAAWLLGVEGPVEMSFPTPGPTATPTITPSPMPTVPPTPEGES
jgi:hypothetical protein